MNTTHKAQKGYKGIAFWQPKDKENVGTVFRNAHAFDVDFICVIGERIQYNQSSNTSKSERHIPVFKYKDMDDFIEHIPFNCALVSVEVDGESISDFEHPERAIYLFGGEDRTLPEISIDSERIKIDTGICLNMATTSALVLFDRQQKNGK